VVASSAGGDGGRKAPDRLIDPTDVVADHHFAEFEIISIGTGVVDGLKVLDPDGRLEKRL
jgi:hypothetical protein